MTLARYTLKLNLTKLAGPPHVVDDNDTTCDWCDRQMAIGEIGYGGQYNGHDVTTFFCNRCARDYSRPGRHDRLFYEAMAYVRMGQSAGLRRHDRRALKQWNRPHYIDRQIRNNPRAQEAERAQP